MLSIFHEEKLKGHSEVEMSQRDVSLWKSIITGYSPGMKHLCIIQVYDAERL